MRRFQCDPCRIKESRRLVLPRTSCYIKQATLDGTTIYFNRKGFGRKWQWSNRVTVPAWSKGPRKTTTNIAIFAKTLANVQHSTENIGGR
jgi:hypothetical protein